MDALALIGAGVIMLYWSWGTWPDVLVDFGRELYVPWQITEGKVLYRDLAHFSGPLSPYVNAMWLRLFGVSLRSLVIGNIVISAALTVLLYQLLCALTGRASALTGSLVFILLFACTELRTIGNYNFICPYSHELTHGIALSFGGIWCLWRYVRHRRRATLWLAGICTGLTFLTKPEVFAALAVAMLVPLPLVIRTELPERRRFFILSTIVAGGVIPIVAAAGLFSFALSPQDAIAALFESWRPLLNPTLRRELAALPFYRAVTGTGNVFLSLGQMILWGGVYAAMLGYAYWKAVQAPGKLDRRFPVSVVVVVCAGAILLARYWPEQARPLPLFASLWVASVIPSVWRTRDQHEASLAVLQVAWATFGTAMLLKIALNASFGHYGFGLAMPATVGLVSVLMGGVPASVERHGGSPAIFKWAAVTLVFVLLLDNLAVSGSMFRRKTLAVGSNGDRFLADARAGTVNQAVAHISAHLRPDDTLVVLPEGIMLNYLTRRPNPTRFINFMPSEMMMFGERPMLDALRSHPPDYIVVVHKDTSEYGVRFFGRDYGRDLLRWVTETYEPEVLFGAVPLQTDGFGIAVLRRRPGN